ncbi:hypothetical protein N5923_23530 [Erwiniaceae bacterium BAC15a-03b]|uniref:DUF551 domain-containing protein n=1 Tax=Winslowiella arboricola TaxID=2978220 RepID=A0A9J6PZY1_9GAMM|nr:hypothetical protein [Winslowiella arboricola]MCU5775078.1 hypothetical protein [Winslowiella arboricola]MCU5780468.1 hypothetical protein [Winslowiella arboricola]
MEWIDLEKQTPEDEQRCVVFTDDGEYKTAVYQEDAGDFSDLDWDERIYDVKAWTPLYECTI